MNMNLPHFPATLIFTGFTRVLIQNHPVAISEYHPTRGVARVVSMRWRAQARVGGTAGPKWKCRRCLPTVCSHLDTVTTSRWWVYEQEMLISSPKIRTEQDFLMGFKTIRWERERIRGMVIHIVKESKEPLSLSRFQMPYSALQFWMALNGVGLNNTDKALPSMGK